MAGLVTGPRWGITADVLLNRHVVQLSSNCLRFSLDYCGSWLCCCVQKLNQRPIADQSDKRSAYSDLMGHQISHLLRLGEHHGRGGGRI